MAELSNFPFLRMRKNRGIHGLLILGLWFRLRGLTICLSKCESGTATSDIAILEKIFFYLDYESFKTCFEICTTWRGLLTSEWFQKKAKLQFWLKIEEDEEKLLNASGSGNAQEVQKLLSLGLFDINCPKSEDKWRIHTQKR